MNWLKEFFNKWYNLHFFLTMYMPSTLILKGHILNPVQGFMQAKQYKLFVHHFIKLIIKIHIHL